MRGFCIKSAADDVLCHRLSVFPLFTVKFVIFFTVTHLLSFAAEQTVSPIVPHDKHYLIFIIGSGSTR